MFRRVMKDVNMKQHLMLIGVAAAAMAVAAEPAAAPVPAASSVSSDVVALPPPPKDTDVVASVGDATLTWGDLQKQAAQDVEAICHWQCPVPLERVHKRIRMRPPENQPSLARSLRHHATHCTVRFPGIQKNFLFPFPTR